MPKTTSFHRPYRRGEDPREIFAANLDYLVSQHFSSRHEAAIVMNIGRTQLNRYLNAEALPSTSPLLRILKQFHVDGRVLTDPLPETLESAGSPLPG